MAVTYAYPTTTPELQDLLIGTEIASQGGEDAPRTRTFTMQSVVDLATATFIASSSNLYAPKLNPVFSGTVTGVTKAMVGLSNVDNTTDALKPISADTQTALNLKANLATPTFTGLVTAQGFKTPTGTNVQFLMADGTTTTGPSYAVPTLQQVTTAGSTTTVGITASTSANGAVPIKGVVNWDGAGAQNNVAVLGEVSSTTSIPGIGVKGISPSGVGVQGVGKFGIHGQSTVPAGMGVWGESFSTGPGVYGAGTAGYGGYFYSDYAEAIYCEGRLLAQSDITTDGNFIKSDGTPTQSLMANGTTRNISIFNNRNATQIIPAATVTYLTGSNISIANVKSGSVVNWDIAVLKTAAGVAPPVFTVRFGTTGTTADSTLLTFTGSAQTAVADDGLFSIKCTFTTFGSEPTTAILAGHYTLIHNAQAVGLSVLPVNFSFQTSPEFNLELADAVLGVTVNSGAAAAWTINQVSVKLENQV